MYARMLMDWSVFPRPISSARIPFTPFSCSRMSQLRPSSWYGRSWPCKFLGWRKRKVSSRLSLLSESSACAAARRREGDMGSLASALAFSARGGDFLSAPRPKCWKMSDCFRRYCRRCEACSWRNALFSSLPFSMCASRAFRAFRTAWRLAFCAVVSSRGLRMLSLGASLAAACVRLREPDTVRFSRSARRRACASSAAASAAALSASKRSRSAFACSS
mmetsp:Transcript_7817/g.29339  ORF Transcript_7817/g.29339 Transcript_7817/m.29339 type:complete len:219 (-) Transcript_7817:336-992(-)